MLGRLRNKTIMTMPLSKIPTVSQLYRSKKLSPVQDSDASELPEPSQSLNDRIALIRGDITKLEVDAIVNAANNSLLGGGGVDGAIHAAAGSGLVKECRKLKGCKTGSAKITGAYELPCKKVIHAVGPVYDSWSKKTSAELLAGCYTTSLELAVENDCRSIAFSALSTGVYGYPSMAAAPVAIDAVKDFLESKDGDKIDRVVFCTFVEKDVKAYDEWLPKFFPPTPQDLKDADELDSAEAEETTGTEIAAGKENIKDNSEELDNIKKGLEAIDNTETNEATVQDAKDSAETPIRAEDLPDVPTEEPAAQGEPASKKQKSDHE